MKVKELIEHLQSEDPDSEVVLAYQYGDYWRNMVADEIGAVEELGLVWSEYHDKWLMPRAEEDNRDRKSFVVLSADQLDG